MAFISSSRFSNLLPLPAIPVLPSIDRLKGLVAKSFSSFTENVSYYWGGSAGTTPLPPSLEGRVSVAPTTLAKQENSPIQQSDLATPIEGVLADNENVSYVSLVFDLPANPAKRDTKHIRYIVDFRVASEHDLPAPARAETTPPKSWLSSIKSIVQIFFLLFFFAGGKTVNDKFRDISEISS